MKHESFGHEALLCPEEITDYYAAITNGTYDDMKRELQRLYRASLGTEALKYGYSYAELTSDFFTKYEILNRLSLPGEEDFDAKISFPAIEVLSLIPILTFGPNRETDKRATYEDVEVWYRSAIIHMIDANSAEHRLNDVNPHILPGTCMNCDEVKSYPTRTDILRSEACPILNTRLFLQRALENDAAMSLRTIDTMQSNAQADVAAAEFQRLFNDIGRQEPDVFEKRVLGRVIAGVGTGILSEREGDAFYNQYHDLIDPLPQHLR